MKFPFKFSFLRTFLAAGLLFTALPVLAKDTVSAQLPKDGEKAVCEGKGIDGQLKLSDEQRSKLGALRDRFTLDTASKKADLQVSLRQMHELLVKPTIDKSAVLSLQAKINGLNADLSTARLNMMLASGEVFTPEQKAKMKEWRKGGCPGGRCGAPGSFGKELKSRAQDAKPIS